MTAVIGIDVGMTGAIACLRAGQLVGVEDMPVLDKRVNPHELARIIAGWGHVDAVAVEWAQAYPGNGSGASFNYGIGYGMILGVLAVMERPVLHVKPRVWMKAFGLDSDKDAHRRKAIERWPAEAGAFARKKDDGRADAALIAMWAHSEVRLGSAWVHTDAIGDR